MKYEIKHLWIHIFHETGWAPTSQLLILLIRVWRMVTGCLYCNLLLTTGFLQIKRKASHESQNQPALPAICISTWLMQLSSNLKSLSHFSSEVFQIWGVNFNLINISANREIKWSCKLCNSSDALMIMKKKNPLTLNLIETNRESK